MGGKFGQANAEWKQENPEPPSLDGYAEASLFRIGEENLLEEKETVTRLSIKSCICYGESQEIEELIWFSSLIISIPERVSESTCTRYLRYRMLR